MSKSTKIFEGFYMFKMANISMMQSGLSYLVWISVKSGEEYHGPRIKVSKNCKFTSVFISDTLEIKGVDNIGISPKSLKEITEWILLNKNLLIQYWETGILGIPSTQDTIANLKSI